MSTSRRADLLAAIFGVSVVTGFAAGAVRAETLGDAITLAYGTNPTLQAQRASQRALDENYVQASSGYRPTVGIKASATYDDNRSPLVGTTSTSGAALQINQPIYTGGRVSSQVTAAEADILAGRAGLRRVEEGVLQNVIQVYVDVRRDEARLAISQENVDVLKRQLDESNARFEVGEITRTDVAQTQARLAAAQAQLSSAQAQLSISRANYAAAVGQNPGELAVEPPMGQLLPATIDQAFDVAERNSPLLRQSDYAEQGSAARVAEAKAETRPSASLQASLGYNGGTLGASPFVDYSRDIFVSAVATVPLFTGGLTSSQIRQAAERNNVDRIGIEGARRQVLQEVAQAWNQLLGARANLVANEEQVKATAIAYEGTRQEAQVGLRTTLDVLNAEQELRNAQLALVGARHDEYVAGASVLAAMGTLNAEDLASGVALYDAKANFNKVKNSFGWVPWEPLVSAIDHVAAPGIVARPTPLAAPAETPPPSR